MRDKHSEQFKFTSEGNVRLEYNGKNWNWIKNWDHNKQEKQAEEIAKKMREGGVAIGSEGLISTGTKFYGEE